MYIKNIQLTNFRNYDVLETEFHKNVNLILGNNAQGKTNLLEAVYISSIGRSFRTNKDSDLVRFAADFAKLKVSAEKEIYDTSVEIIIKNLKNPSKKTVSSSREHQIFLKIYILLYFLLKI